MKFQMDECLPVASNKHEGASSNHNPKCSRSGRAVTPIKVMSRVLPLAAMVGLAAGCQYIPGATENLVAQAEEDARSMLADPQTVQFKNMMRHDNEICGNVVGSNGSAHSKDNYSDNIIGFVWEKDAKSKSNDKSDPSKWITLVDLEVAPPPIPMLADVDTPGAKLVSDLWKSRMAQKASDIDRLTHCIEGGKPA
jgi:hypothetical protein